MALRGVGFLIALLFSFALTALAAESRPAVGTSRKGVGPCNCPREVKLVCGENGRTFSNKCQAECAKVKVVKLGACKPVDPALRAAASKQGMTKADGATAAKKDSSGVKTCNCNQLADPVCGNNGRSYLNACTARCAGVKIIGKGACKSASKSSTA